MKLYDFDEKHQDINNELDLGDLDEKQIELVGSVLDWMEKIGMQNSYRSIVLA